MDQKDRKLNLKLAHLIALALLVSDGMPVYAQDVVKSVAPDSTLSVSPPKDSKKSQTFLNAAEADIASGYDASANKNIRDSILYDHENARAFLLQGNQFKKEGDNAIGALKVKAYDDAIDSYETSMGLDPLNPDVYFRIGEMFRYINQFDTAAYMYEVALELSPEHLEAKTRLGEVEKIADGFRKNEVAKLKKDITNAKSSQMRFRKRIHLVQLFSKESFSKNLDSQADSYSSELLADAKNFLQDKAYGDAIHLGNIVLGRMKLKEGKVDEAKLFLKLAGQTPGSPILNNFGPNKVLAEELLEKVEKVAVLAYLDACEKFWTSELGKANIPKWKQQIAAGEKVLTRKKEK